MAWLTPEQVDMQYMWPRGRAAKLANSGALPGYRLPDGTLAFKLAELEALVRRWSEEGKAIVPPVPPAESAGSAEELTGQGMAKNQTGALPQGERVMDYRIEFADGSLDVYSAQSAAHAKKQARADFGQPVRRVVALDLDEDEADENGDDDDDHEDEEEEDDGEEA